MLPQFHRALPSGPAAEMIRLGAYRKGSSEEVDQAVQYYPQLPHFLRQRKDEQTELDKRYDERATLLGIENWREAKVG
jgi:flagellum-specific ATP synthase